MSQMSTIGYHQRCPAYSLIAWRCFAFCRKMLKVFLRLRHDHAVIVFILHQGERQHACIRKL